MRRRVLLDPRDAAPVLKHVHPTVRRDLKEALRRLAEDPSGRTFGLDVKELRSLHPQGPAHRLRVGDWRAVFLVHQDRILVLRVFHRGDGYGWLERLGPPQAAASASSARPAPSAPPPPTASSPPAPPPASSAPSAASAPSAPRPTRRAGPPSRP